MRRLHLRVDGQIVRGCLVLAVQLDGAKVETIEGLSDSGAIRDLQDAFVARNAAQCGYCTPGMLVTAADLLATNPAPTREEIREHISGNYCRCTGYHAIVDAVEMAVARAARKRGGVMSTANTRTSPLNDVDRPNSYIGKSVPRPNMAKLVEGRGQFVDDIVLPRMVHVAFVRSPHAHARIRKIDASGRAEDAGCRARVHWRRIWRRIAIRGWRCSRI